MALKDKSLLLYGFTIDDTNQNLPFKASSGGAELNAVIDAGYYTLGTLLTAIKTAMQAIDTANTYTVTADRSANSNTENRITISTSGTFLSLLFSSGSTAAASITSVINFGSSDLTGSTSYTNSVTSGTSLQPGWWGKNYQPPQTLKRVIGNMSIAADGTKESIVWYTSEFIQVEFENEPEASVLAYWEAFIDWIVALKPFEFTPEIGTPATVYSVTLEKSSEAGKGMGFKMKEQLPDKPFFYTTGALEFRVLPI